VGPGSFDRVAQYGYQLHPRHHGTNTLSSAAIAHVLWCSFAPQPAVLAAEVTRRKCFPGRPGTIFRGKKRHFFLQRHIDARVGAQMFKQGGGGALLRADNKEVQIFHERSPVDFRR
jgi:hypothetical protein